MLRYAGGAPVLANPNRVQLERIDPSQPLAKRYVETFALDAAGQQKPLRDGDVLTLLAISPQFANAVTLKGHVAQPLRYPFTPGMRIRDLIPDRDALISPDFYRRKNLLVQVIEDDDERAAHERRHGDATSTRTDAARAATARRCTRNGVGGVRTRGTNDAADADAASTTATGRRPTATRTRPQRRPTARERGPRRRRPLAQDAGRRSSTS